jgi:energy-coupling factor transporter ATP-binding protein EcfA2
MILGILGSNGTGKSTALGVLSGKTKPNLGNVFMPPGWADIIKFYRGSDLQNYFKKLAEGKLTVASKPQMDAQVFLEEHGGENTVEEVLKKWDQRGVYDEMLVEFSLTCVHWSSAPPPLTQRTTSSARPAVCVRVRVFFVFVTPFVFAQTALRAPLAIKPCAARRRRLY